MVTGKVLKTNCRGAAGQSILQPQYTHNPQNLCEGVITNALQSYSNELGKGITDVDVMRVFSVLWL